MTPAFENITGLDQAAGRVGYSLAAYDDTPVKPLDQDRVRDIATQALENAFRSEMDRLMYVAVAGSPTDHLEAIIKANSSVEQLVGAKKWIECIVVPEQAHLEAAVPPAPAEAPGADNGMGALLGELLRDWSFQAAKRMADAKYETDPMGRRMMENGAMCIFNCAMAIRHVLLSEHAGQAARDLALEVFKQNPESP